MFISIPGYFVCYFKFRELFILFFWNLVEDCQGWPKPKTYNSILRGGRKLFTSVEPLAHLVSSTNHSASVLDQAFLQWSRRVSKIDQKRANFFILFLPPVLVDGPAPSDRNDAILYPRFHKTTVYDVSQLKCP